MAPPSLITPPHRPASIAWLVLGQDDCPGDDHWLGPAERDTVAAMAVARRRRDWRLGRWTAKRAIFAHSAELGQLAASRHATGFGRLEIRSAADGAPQAFFDGTPAPVSLSMRTIVPRPEQATLTKGSGLTAGLLSCSWVLLLLGPSIPLAWPP